MASNTSYDYQKPSTIATRSLVTGTKPAETTSASSHDSDSHDRPTLQRNPTDHYQQAVSAATSKAVGAEEPAIPKPTLERQQSWKQTDMKRGHMEKILGSQSGAQNYTTTSPT
ncbi:hypothetical protein AMS68_006300 [Peltaster fructicola]|uniref:Uncharacterized protein n=1 Tax=Peltaster fructicola TaxID=286661 RepID=A0A6H0Y1A0_9PEZI|nr:hypothetical protein AMS68_006300 [Peltaster fructicola]